MPGPDDEKQEVSNPVTTVTDPAPQKSVTDWEGSYKGLQKVVANRDTIITELREQINLLNGQVEDLKAQLLTATTIGTETGKQKDTLATKLTETEKERDQLKKSLSQNAIILNDFPHLAKLVKYIPAANDDEEFRANAKTFSETLDETVKAKVTETLAGSTPPQPKGGEAMATDAEEDKLYHEMMALAGVSGKEKEYESLREKWVRIQQTKQR